MLCDHQWSEPFTVDPMIPAHVAPNKFSRCARCRVIRTIEQNPLNQLSLDESDRIHWGDQSGFFKDAIPKFREWLHHDRKQALQDTLDWNVYFHDPMILCVGPGPGQVFPWLIQQCRKIYTVEIGDWLCQWLAELFPTVAVHQGSILDSLPDDWPSDFPIVFSNHCMEHIPEADVAFSREVDLVRSGGQFYCEVPATLDREGEYNIPAWRELEFHGLNAPDHRWHFSEHTLRAWAEAAGLVDVEIRRTCRGETLMDYHLLARKP